MFCPHLAKIPSNEEIATDPQEKFEGGFYRANCHPLVWVKKADKLAEAADLLWEAFEQRNPRWTTSIHHDSDMAAISIMLSGCAIEVLLKAIIISSNPDNFKSGLPASLTKHYLLKLSEEAKVKRENGDHNALEELERFIIYAGRYPIPKTPDPTNPTYLLTMPLWVHGVAKEMLVRWKAEFDKRNSEIRK